ncbi:MAG: hypothetical protein ACRETL_04655 [Gammaproteobacteria bacterium]
MSDPSPSRTQSQIESSAPARQENPGADQAYSADRVEYMADLIAELRELAEKGRMDTLAAILSLATNEAQQQALIRKRT